MDYAHCDTVDGHTAIAQWGRGLPWLPLFIVGRPPSKPLIVVRPGGWCIRVYNSIQPTLVAVEAEFNCRPTVLARPISQQPLSTSRLNDVTFVASLQKHRPIPVVMRSLDVGFPHILQFEIWL